MELEERKCEETLGHESGYLLLESRVWWLCMPSPQHLLENGGSNPNSIRESYGAGDWTQGSCMQILCLSPLSYVPSPGAKIRGYVRCIISEASWAASRRRKVLTPKETCLVASDFKRCQRAELQWSWWWLKVHCLQENICWEPGLPRNAVMVKKGHERCSLNPKAVLCLKGREVISNMPGWEQHNGIVLQCY